MAKLKKKIIVVGETYAVLGFKGQGLDVLIIEDEANIAKNLEEIIKTDKYGIIFFTSYIKQRAINIIEKYRSVAVPALIQIPMGQVLDVDGSLLLQEAVKRAVGFDILATEKNENENYDVLPEEDYEYYLQIRNRLEI